MITYSTSEAGTPDFSSAPRIAMASRSVPEKSLSEPIKRPIGVRAPATITDVVIPASKGGGQRLIGRTGPTRFLPSGYRYVATTEHLDMRPLLANSLVTAVDHVGTSPTWTR